MVKKQRKSTLKILIVFFIVILIVFILIGINKQMIKILYKKDFEQFVTKYAKEYEIDESLIYAIIKAESNFKADAVSSSDAMGLMQLMYSTAEDVAKKIGLEINEDNIFEPNININLGTKYMADLIEKYGYIELALAAYNAGSGNVDKWIKNGIIKSDGSDIENIPFKETNIYVRKILRDYEIYIQLK